MLRIIFFLLNIALLAFGENNLDSIKNDLTNAKSTAFNHSAIKIGNVIWPDSDTIKAKRILRKDIPDSIHNKNLYWLKLFIRPSTLIDDSSLIYLSDMDKGDDWIISRKVSDLEYVQIIDARIITLVIKKNIDINDTHNIEKKITNAIKNNLLLTVPRDFMIIERDDFQISAILKYKDEKIAGAIHGRISLWTNGKYVVVNIPKINLPQFSKYGISIDRTVGGIALEDTKAFKRFDKNDNYDLKKELYRLYPWIDDSLKIWSKLDRGDGAPVLFYKDEGM